MGLTLTNAFMMCAQRPQAYGSHLAPPPRSHGVVGILFCLPVFTSGIGGFIATITNGKVTDPDMFTLHLAGVDFAKNMMIALQCYVGTKMDSEAQKFLAWTMVAMCAMVAPNLFIYPFAPLSECVPPLLYLTIVPTTYIVAITGSGKGKSS